MFLDAGALWIFADFLFRRSKLLLLTAPIFYLLERINPADPQQTHWKAICNLIYTLYSLAALFFVEPYVVTYFLVPLAKLTGNGLLGDFFTHARETLVGE